MKNLILILTSVFMGSIGQVLLKVGANKLNKTGSFLASANNMFLDLINILKTPQLIIGIILFGTSFLLWLKVLTKSDLSYAYPMVSLGYIVVVLFSFFLFKETLTIQKFIGISFIIAGAIFINK